MKKSGNSIYFGITFSEDFPLDQKKRKQLAKLLFALPNTSTEEAHRILMNLSLLKSIDQVIESLFIELNQITGILFCNKTKENIQDLILSKLISWSRIFYFPTLNELSEITCHYKLSRKEFLKEVLKSLISEELPSPQLLDFLKKYNADLTFYQIDEILDFYNKKSIDPKLIAQQILLFNTEDSEENRVNIF